MKRLVNYFQILSLSLLLLSVNCFAQNKPGQPEVAAKAWLLQDFNSGEILAAKNENMRIEPASMTKIMTSFVVFDQIKQKHLNLEDEFHISEKAWRTGGSRMFIEVDTKVAVGSLLKGLIIQSGNDASVALAEGVAGSEDAFADMMNNYAAKLGMRKTHFVNASGWPHANHYTTASDLAILTRALISNFPEHYKWYAEKNYKYNKIEQHNRNRLLWRDDSVDGVKTGHTESAGYCLISSAKRNKMRLISIMVGASNDSDRNRFSQRFLDWGFRFFETRKIYNAGTQIGKKIPVWQGDKNELRLGAESDLFVTLPRGQLGELRSELAIADDVIAPIKMHQPIGVIKLIYQNKVIKTGKVIALDSVQEGNFLKKIYDSVKIMVKNNF